MPKAWAAAVPVLAAQLLLGGPRRSRGRSDTVIDDAGGGGLDLVDGLVAVPLWGWVGPRSSPDGRLAVVPQHVVQEVRASLVGLATDG